jgi:hypothetical protein
MTDKSDCRMIGSWLMRAAEAQYFWSQALRDPRYERRVSALFWYCVPHLECIALEILVAVKREHHVLAVNLDWTENESAISSLEFAMLVQLGFFARAGVGYQMIVPQAVTLENVRQAGLEAALTGNYDGEIKPKFLLRTMARVEAEAWRCIRLSPSRRGFRIGRRPLLGTVANDNS